jgi:hypothetical protein
MRAMNGTFQQVLDRLPAQGTRRGRNDQRSCGYGRVPKAHDFVTATQSRSRDRSPAASVSEADTVQYH